MDEITPEEFDRQTHEYLADFVNSTRNESGGMTGSVKMTIVQFLMNLKQRFNLVAQDGYLTREDLITCQIDELRLLIIDLQALLTYKDSTQ